MENVLLVRYGEIHLKGLNRPFFERKLVEGIKHALSDLGATVRMEQGRIFVLGIRIRTGMRRWTGSQGCSAYIP